MNKSDSERIAAVFEDMGIKEAPSRKEADFVVLTTCGVRQGAEDRAYGLVRRIKMENPFVKIILAGCLSERADVIERLKDDVALWLPARAISDFRFMILDLIQDVIDIRRPADVGRLIKQEYLSIKPKYDSSFSAFVPIGNGCDNFCTYCVVPYARGREVYRPADEIIAEVEDLVTRRGYKEIVLIAQNVNSFECRMPNAECRIGDDVNSDYSEFPTRLPDGQVSNFPAQGWSASGGQFPNNFQFSNDKILKFSDILRLVNAIDGDFWIRFATSHPKDMSDDLIAAIAECEKVCKHIHLPAQSGDNEILQRMNRKYTREHYLGLIGKIREVSNAECRMSNAECRMSNAECRMPNVECRMSNKYRQPLVSLTTDIIVGFPGETEEQFQNTVKLFEEVKFDMAYIAQYSPRPGTAAEKLDDDVPAEEKKRREQELNDVLKNTALENNQAYLGKTVKVLVEEKNKKNEYFGRTETAKTVKIFGCDDEKIGKFIFVKIEKVKDFGLEGSLEN